jgi:Fe2+ or Zn2+ uptake regulation protein
MADKVRLANILIFKNGNIAVFDESGNQVPELQNKTVLDLIRDFAASQGFSTEGCRVEVYGCGLNEIDFG